VTQPGGTNGTRKPGNEAEDAVAGLGNIDNMISTVDDGVSTTTVNFVLGTDSDRATNDVRNAVAQTAKNCPKTLTSHRPAGLCRWSNHDLRCGHSGER